MACAVLHELQAVGGIQTPIFAQLMLGTDAEVETYAAGVRAVGAVVTDGGGGIVAYHVADEAQLTEYQRAIAALVAGAHAELGTEVLQGAGLEPCALPAIRSKVLQARLRAVAPYGASSEEGMRPR